MSTPCCVRYPLTALLFCAVIPLALPAAQTPHDTASADARLRALYTEEWAWRQKEMARGDQPGEGGASDHFPKVDAASQQARLAYWSKEYVPKARARRSPRPPCPTVRRSIRRRSRRTRR